MYISNGKHTCKQQIWLLGGTGWVVSPIHALSENLLSRFSSEHNGLHKTDTSQSKFICSLELHV